MRERETVENLGRYRLRQRAHLPKLGTDSNQLAQFVTLHARERVCDLGCGVGVLGLLLAQRQADLTLDGIELVAESAQLAVENLRENELRGTVIHGDLREYRRWFTPPGGYDLVVSNPPYFASNAGKTAMGARKAAAVRRTARWRMSAPPPAGCCGREDGSPCAIGQNGWPSCLPPYNGVGWNPNDCSWFNIPPSTRRKWCWWRRYGWGGRG